VKRNGEGRKEHRLLSRCVVPRTAHRLVADRGIEIGVQRILPTQPEAEDGLHVMSASDQSAMVRNRKVVSKDDCLIKL
jgi:hypothetical protein